MMEGLKAVGYMLIGIGSLILIYLTYEVTYNGTNIFQ